MSCTVCGGTPVGVFLGGARCADDTPAALAGRPEPADLVDPERIYWSTSSPGQNASAVIEERNRVSGKTASKTTRAKVRAS